MSIAFRRQSFKILSCFAPILIFAVTVHTQRPPKASTPQLFAIAATPHADDPYPVTLYRVVGRLDRVRDVVPQPDGSDYPRASGRVIVFPYPNRSPHSIAIVHTDDPTRVDNVVFRAASVLGTPPMDLAEPPKSGQEFLAAWFGTPINPANPSVRRDDGYQVAISMQKMPGSPRVRADRWSDYAYWRSDGVYGGPVLSPTMIGASTEDGNIVLKRFGHSITISSLPPAIRNVSPKFVPFTYVATGEYLVLEMTAGKGYMQVPEASELFVYDRNRRSWKTIHTEGTYPTLRLFGHWIAERVANHPENPAVSPRPGSDNERTWEERTDDLPPVQALYRTLSVEGEELPGVLALQNLVDGRKIRIETDQEDSEILWAGDNLVLYRVNDAIYKATITGDKLQDTTMIVKDDDVPEIHWVFWSK